MRLIAAFWAYVMSRSINIAVLVKIERNYYLLT